MYSCFRLINTLRKHAGKPAVKYGCQNNLTAFIALENIATFNKAAQDYGLPETSLFQSVDLYECQKGPFLNVINCLNKLGFQVRKILVTYSLPSKRYYYRTFLNMTV